MHFVVLPYEVEERLGVPGRAEQYWAEWRAYGQALSEADVLVALSGLEPRACTDTPRPPGGARGVRVGPDTHPSALPGGYFILDVADLHEAVDWASRCPAAANGVVEVRLVRLSG